MNEIEKERDWYRFALEIIIQHDALMKQTYDGWCPVCDNDDNPEQPYVRCHHEWCPYEVAQKAVQAYRKTERIH